MKLINENFVKDSIPFRYNRQKLERIGLIQQDQFSDEYFKIYSTYKFLLEKWILSVMPLRYYEDKIKFSKYSFDFVSEDSMDVYQYYSNMNLNYIYLRNNIYVENFDEKEIKYILDKCDSNNLVLDNNTIEFLNRTYKKAISDSFCDPFLQTNIIYHPSNNFNYSLASDTIVLGLRYDEFSGEEEEYAEKEKYVYNLMSNLNKELKQHNAVILKYGEYSVKKKITEELDQNNNLGL